MASIVNDTSSTVVGSDVAGSIRHKLSEVKKNNRIKFAGRDGLFVGNKMFATLETALDEALASGSMQGSTTELLELNEELDALRRQALVAESALSFSSEQLAERTKALSETNTALATSSEEYKTLLDSSVETINKWKAQNEAQKSQITTLNKQISAAKTGNDVDGLPALLEAKAKLSTENSETQKFLAQANAEKTKALAERNALKKQVLQLEKAKDESQAEVRRLIQLKKESVADVTVEPVKIEFDEGLVKTILGQSGFQWLVKAETQAREDMRERAYALLLAVKSKNSKRLSGIVDLLQIAFDWVKSRPFAVRKKIQPWLDAIGKDLRFGTLRTAQYYRQLLEKVVGQVKKVKSQVETAHAKATESYPWYQTFWAGAYVLPRRYLRRAGRKIKSAVKPVVSALKGTATVAVSVVKAVVSPVKTAVNATYTFFRNQYRGFYKGFYTTHLRLHDSGMHPENVKGCPKCAMAHDPERFVKQYQWVQESFPELFAPQDRHDKTPIVMFDAEAEAQEIPGDKGKGKA